MCFRLVYIASNSHNLQQGHPMDELSLFGIGFAAVIFGLSCMMALKLASKKAYH